MSFKPTWCVEIKNSKQEKVLDVTIDNKLNFTTQKKSVFSKKFGLDSTATLEKCS